MNWIYMLWDMAQWQTFVNAVKDCSFHKVRGISLLLSIYVFCKREIIVIIIIIIIGRGVTAGHPHLAPRLKKKWSSTSTSPVVP
jgi:hypothetical protein